MQTKVLMVRKSKMIHSKMVRIDRDVYIPNSYVKTIKPENKSHMLFILSPYAKFARFIPCSKEVTKIRLVMPEVAPKFVMKMEEVYFHTGIKPLHASASNNDHLPLVYESYIDNQQFDFISLDELVVKLRKLPGVTDVVTETLNTPKLI